MNVKCKCGTTGEGLTEELFGEGWIYIDEEWICPICPNQPETSPEVDTEMVNFFNKTEKRLKILERNYEVLASQHHTMKADLRQLQASLTDDVVLPKEMVAEAIAGMIGNRMSVPVQKRTRKTRISDYSEGV